MVGRREEDAWTYHTIRRVVEGCHADHTYHCSLTKSPIVVPFLLQLVTEPTAASPDPSLFPSPPSPLSSSATLSSSALTARAFRGDVSRAGKPGVLTIILHVLEA